MEDIFKKRTNTKPKKHVGEIQHPQLLFLLNIPSTGNQKAVLARVHPESDPGDQRHPPGRLGKTCHRLADLAELAVAFGLSCSVTLEKKGTLFGEDTF